MADFEFYDENPQAYPDPSVVVRDHIGDLALQLLVSKSDISQMSYSDLLDKYYEIIVDLQKAYHQKSY